jgi:hypothetical protein
VRTDDTGERLKQIESCTSFEIAAGLTGGCLYENPHGRLRLCFCGALGFDFVDLKISHAARDQDQEKALLA